MNKMLYEKFHAIQSRHWWFQARRAIVVSMIDSFAKKLRINTSDQCKLLDLGCGCGVMLEALSKRFSCYGVDVSEDAIQFACDSTGLDIKQGSLPSQIPFQENFFDIVLALDVIEHVDDDLSSLKKIESLLKPGGIAVITVPAYQWLWTVHDDINEHKRRYTQCMLETLIDHTNLNLHKISYFNSILFPLIMPVRLLQKILKPSKEQMLKMPNEKINHFLYRIFSVERHILNRFGFPFGLSVIAVLSKN